MYTVIYIAIVIVVLITIQSIGLLICYRFSAWRKLAPDFATTLDLNSEDTILKWAVVTIGRSRYGRSVTVALNRKGFLIKPMKFLQVTGRPPLFIPWSAVDVAQEKQSLRGAYLEIILKNGTNIGMEGRAWRAIQKLDIKI
ncbi:MAG: hypothetical protein GY810_06360 [Aureispira sp.]|nr:hypothetical protein [Aureispira sp.]